MSIKTIWDHTTRRVELEQGDAFVALEELDTSHQDMWPVFPERPFDRAACHALYVKALLEKRNVYRPGTGLGPVFQSFSKKCSVLSVQEATFWLRVLVCEAGRQALNEPLTVESSELLGRRVGAVDVETPVTPEELAEGFNALVYHSARAQTPQKYATYLAQDYAPLALCVREALGVVQGLRALFMGLNIQDCGLFFSHFGHTRGFEKEAIALLHEFLDRAELDHPNVAFFSTLAPLLERCPDPDYVRAVVPHCKDTYMNSNARARLPMIFEDGEEVLATFYTLKTSMNTTQAVQFYARHGETHLDALMKFISGRLCKHRRADLVEALLPIASVKLAPWMLDLAQDEVTRDVARHWLREQGVHATLGLMDLVKSRGKQRGQAIEELRAIAEQGHSEEIRALLPHVASPTARELIAQEVLAFEREEVDMASAEQWPEWVVQVMRSTDIEEREFKAYTKMFALSKAPLVMLSSSPHALPVEVLERVLGMVDRVHPLDDRKGPAGRERDAREALQARCRALLLQVKEGVDEATLGAWMWYVWEQWWGKGQPIPLASCLSLFGYCGTDREVTMIEPRIMSSKKWLTRIYNKRYAMALMDGLEQMGTPTCWMVLEGLRRHGRNNATRRHAHDQIQRIRKAHGWDEAMWYDRIAPYGGLDERGTRVFDYGGRRFELRFRGAFDVEFVNEEGEHLAHLPPARKSDDVDAVKQARADFKIIKAQLEQVIAQQTRRLERAMTSLHAWSEQDWWEYIAGHRLLRHFARKLLWVREHDSGARDLFVLAEDGSTLGAGYEELTWAGDARVRIVHPVELDEEERTQWVEVLTDFEVVQPFLQLEREIFRRADGDFDEVFALLDGKRAWELYESLRDVHGESYWGTKANDYHISAMWHDYGVWRCMVLRDVEAWGAGDARNLPGRGVYALRGPSWEVSAIVPWEEVPAAIYSEACRAARRMVLR